MIPSKDFIYCPTCGCEFCRTKCKREVYKKIQSVCTNPLTGGYLDDYEYEERKQVYMRTICPNNHILENSFMYSEAI